jgi:hypothetical protein
MDFPSNTIAVPVTYLDIYIAQRLSKFYITIFKLEELKIQDRR